MCLFDVFVTYRVELCDLLFWCVKSDCVECVCALVCDGVWCVCAFVCFLVRCLRGLVCCVWVCLCMFVWDVLCDDVWFVLGVLFVCFV